MTSNVDVTEIKISRKIKFEKKAKMVREIFEDNDEELNDMGIRIRGINRKAYTE